MHMYVRNDIGVRLLEQVRQIERIHLYSFDCHSFLCEIDENTSFSSKKFHFYCHEKSMYIAWTCFRNVHFSDQRMIIGCGYTLEPPQ